MKVITTPMCEEILRLAGVSEFGVVEFQAGKYGLDTKHHADLAIILQETKVNQDLATNILRIKLNTYPQIKESIKIVSYRLGTKPLNFNLPSPGDINDNRKIKVKVYSNFLREIVEDMGFKITDDETYDFLVYPDYIKHKIKKDISSAGERSVEIPSHKNAPLNPIKRAEMRYKLLKISLY